MSIVAVVQANTSKLCRRNGTLNANVTASIDESGNVEDVERRLSEVQVENQVRGHQQAATGAWSLPMLVSWHL